MKMSVLVFLGCNTTGTCKWIPSFQTNILSPSSRLNVETVCFSIVMVSLLGTSALNYDPEDISSKPNIFEIILHAFSIVEKKA
jgi:hypothetical protein